MAKASPARSGADRILTRDGKRSARQPEREETGEKEIKPPGSLRTDVINALVGQGYNRSDAVMMTDNATGEDFETLFKSALRPAYPRQVNSEHVDASELFTELEQVNSEHVDASEHVHMDEEVEKARKEAANTTPTTKEVNSEQKDASEQFTEFGQDYKLPPTVEQTIKQITGAKHAL